MTKDIEDYMSLDRNDHMMLTSNLDAPKISGIASTIHLEEAHRMKRLAIFVDGSNFFYLQKDGLKWWVDPKKLLAWLKERGQIVDANYYMSVDPSNVSQKSYQKALEHIGFHVVPKIIKTYTNADGTERFKGNMDVDIVLDMINQINNYDEAILISGDADFARPLKVLRARGKQFMILSTKGFISSEIRSVAGMHYQDIAELRDKIAKN